MSITILAIGLMIFFAHFLSLQFRKTNIPDVLVLMLMGILLGPLLGIVTPQDFGKIGPVIATIALVVILFESGTSLNLGVLGRSLATTGVLTLWCFFLTAIIVALLGIYMLDLSLLPATMLGATLGGTSSAVVIPMVEALRLSKKPATVLVLESALTDVLCIVGVFALLQVYTQGGVEPGRLVGGVLSALIFAAVIGVLGGIAIWLLVLWVPYLRWRHHQAQPAVSPRAQQINHAAVSGPHALPYDVDARSALLYAANRTWTPRPLRASPSTSSSSSTSQARCPRPSTSIITTGFPAGPGP